jgi:serine/threonine protein kinase
VIKSIVSISHRMQSNILIKDDGEAALADFGLSRILEVSGFTTKISGTWRYMALELLGEGAPRVTAESDIWALAMTVVEVRISPVTGTLLS